MVRASAISLIHADHIHPGCQPFCREPNRVAGVARTLEAMNDYQSQRRRSITLPVAVTENGNAGLDFDEPLFGGGEMQPSQQQEGGERLAMSAAQQAPRPEWFFGLRRPHLIILNRGRPSRGSQRRHHAHF